MHPKVTRKAESMSGTIPNFINTVSHPRSFPAGYNYKQ
jgi:hypothetical protein